MIGLWSYRATVRRIYDADTIRADIDLGFDVWTFNQSLRLLGINAPEVRGTEREAGLAARDALRAFIPVGSPILIQTVKHDRKGKYGRWLATIYTPDGLDVNAWLVANRHAVARVY